MTDQNLIRLSDVEMVIDELNNNIYIDYKILSLKLEEAFEISKRLLSFFQKTIIFRFNGYYFEVNKETTIDQIKTSYETQEQICHINRANEIFQNAISKLEEKNVKATIEKLTDELSLDKPESIFRPYIRKCDQKQFANKLYRIYRQNHNNERIELLPPSIEIPKIILKNNRQFM